MASYKFMDKKTKIIIAVLIIILAAASRLVKHPFNFTPVVAMSIFAGCYLEKKWAVILPIVSMLVSDYFIGFYDWQVMASVYISISLAFLIGWFLQKRKNWKSIVLASLAASLIFFIVTNFAVWVFFKWYPHTWAGLIDCFILALSFYRNTLAGDLFYTGVFFGIYEIILLWREKRITELVRN